MDTTKQHSGSDDDFVIDAEEDRAVREGSNIPLDATIAIYDSGQSCINFPIVYSELFSEMVRDKKLSPGSTYRVFGNAVEVENIIRLSAKSKTQKELVLKELKAHPADLVDVASMADRLRCTRVFNLLCSEFGKVVRDQMKLPSTPPSSRDEIIRLCNRMRTTLSLPVKTAEQLTHERDMKDVELYFNNPRSLTQSTAVCEETVDLNENPCQFADKTNRLLTPFHEKPWQPDDAVSMCPDCNKSFSDWSMWACRRSHCRSCGLVKCRNCVAYRVDKQYAPLQNPAATYKEGDMRKVCKACSTRSVEHSRPRLRAKILAEAELNVLEIAYFMLVDEDWRNGVYLILNDYRSLFKCEPLTEARRKLLRRSASLFVGHPQSVALLFHAIDWSEDGVEQQEAVAVLRETVALARENRLWNPPEEGGPPFQHWHLLCTRNCAQMHLGFLGVQILLSLNQLSGRLVVEARELAAGLVLDHTDEYDYAAAFLPTLLDQFHLEPSDGSCEVLRNLLIAMAVGSHTLQNGRFAADEEAVVDEDGGLSTANLSLSSLQSNTSGAIQVTGATTSARLKILLLLNVELRYRTEASHKSIQGHFKRLHSSLAFYLGGTLQKQLGLVDAFLNVLEDAEVVKAKETDDMQRLKLVLRRVLGEYGLIEKQHRRRADPSADGCPQSEVVSLLPFPFPFDPSVTIVGIDLSRIKVHRSAIKPLRLSLLSQQGTMHEILFKQEDLRKDYVVCNAFALLQKLVVGKPRGLNKAYKVPSYRVIPTNRNCGIVEIVPNAVTVEQMTHRPQSSERVQPFFEFLDRYFKGEAKQKTARAHFIESVRFYLFATYLLGIGDRHLENVLLCKDSGSMVHIDFGFVLGDCPKIDRAMLENRFCRFDTDLQEAIAQWQNVPRTSSATTKEQRQEIFVNGASQLLVLVRPQLDMLLLMLKHWRTHNVDLRLKDANEINEFVKDRAHIGLNDEDAKRLFREKLTGKETFFFGGVAFRDVLHRAGQEGYLSVATQSLSSFVGTASEYVPPSVSSWWGWSEKQQPPKVEKKK